MQANKKAVDYQKEIKEEKRSRSKLARQKLFNRFLRPKLHKEGFTSKKHKKEYMESLLPKGTKLAKISGADKIVNSAKEVVKKANSHVESIKQARFDNKKLIFNGHNTGITQKEYVDEFLPIFESVDNMWKESNESRDPKYRGYRPTKQSLLEAWIKKKTGSTKGLSDASKRVEAKYKDDPRNPNAKAKKMVEKKKKKTIKRKPKVKVRDTGRSWPFRYERI